MLHLLLAFLLGGSPKPVTLRLDTFQGFPPLAINVQIRIEPQHINRYGCLQYEGEESSKDCWPIDGEEGPITKFKHIILRTPGEYLIIAYSEDVNENVLYITAPIQVHVIEP